jgi:Arylsulfotransferase (ASST)
MSPRIYPTGVTLHDPDASWKGYVLHGAPDRRTHLVDLEGNEVHRWEHLGFPSELLDPALTEGKRGHVLVQLERSREGGRFNGIFDNHSVAELDWDGRVVWKWSGEGPGASARQTHDYERLASGSTLLLTTVDRKVPGFGDAPIPDQVIREVDREGNVVWSWSVVEHLDQFGLSEEGLALLRRGVVSGGGNHGVLTINNLARVGDNRWYDGGDARFHPDNLIIDSREANFIVIIDRARGHVVWRLGPDFPEHVPAPQRILARELPRPVDQLSGQHDAHIIPKGLPGAGNLLVFDNQGAAGFPSARLGIFVGSRVLEIDPITQQIVWQYTGEDSDAPSWTFHSSFISSARRLPNGNTLIDEGQTGRIFQVTPAGRIVWEYVNPHFGDTLIGARTVRSNWVFRAQPVPYAWVPEGTARGERAVRELDPATFRVPR